jgi:hypothetical protein
MSLPKSETKQNNYTVEKIAKQMNSLCNGGQKMNCSNGENIMAPDYTSGTSCPQYYKLTCINEDEQIGKWIKRQNKS